MARRYCLPKDERNGKYAHQIPFRAYLSTILRRRVPSPNRRGSDRDGTNPWAAVGTVWTGDTPAVRDELFSVSFTPVRFSFLHEPLREASRRLLIRGKQLIPFI